MHVRQGGDRQQAVRDKPAQQKASHQQNGRDRPPDEGSGDVHGIACSTALCMSACRALLAGSWCTPAPGCRRYWPAVTTVSFGWRPESIRASPSLICATVTARIRTVESVPITQTNEP